MAESKPVPNYTDINFNTTCKVEAFNHKVKRFSHKICNFKNLPKKKWEKVFQKIC